MNISSISAAGLSQFVLSTNNSTQLQQLLKTLQNSLSSGDLSAAQSAFQSLQKVFQSSASANGNTVSSSSQLATDLTSLGDALNAGDLSTARSAFATVLNDVKATTLPAQSNQAAAASQSVQLVQEVLSSLNPGSSTGTDIANSILDSVYRTGVGLNVRG
jgi:Sec7-like guanine-nucleotide exchange factor